MTLPTPIATLLYFAFLPCMLGLCVSLARDALRRDRRAWLTGQAWLDSLDCDAPSTLSRGSVDDGRATQEEQA